MKETTNRASVVGGLLAVALVFGPSTRADFTPNLNFVVAVPAINPFALYQNFGSLYTPEPPSPFAGQDPHSALYKTGSKNTSVDSFAWIQFYGTALNLRGGSQTPDELTIDNQPIIRRNDSKGDIYTADSLGWDFHSVAYKVQNGDPAPSVFGWAYMTGMQTQAPSLEEANKLVVPFVKDGQVNQNATYITFPWEKYSAEVLSQTPYKSGQTPLPCPAVRIPGFLSDPLIITPPANTSFVMLNATMTDDSQAFFITADPPLPGRTPGQVTNMYLASPDYSLSNVWAFLSPLDPTIQYQITITSNSTTVQHPTFNSVTFVSALWNNATAATADHDRATKSNTPKIAGAVVGAALGAALIAVTTCRLIRRYKKKRKMAKLESFEIDDSALHQPVAFTASTSSNDPAISPSTILSPYPFAPTDSHGHSAPSWCETLSFGTSTTATKQVQPPSDVRTTSGPHKHMKSTAISEPSTGPTDAGSSSGRPVRQEQDLGYLEPDEDEEVVPPSYNPQWEEDARNRAQRQR